MKSIGLIGGTSWPSTIEFYKTLNKMAHTNFGAGHSARILLSSIDYFEIKQHYPSGWEKINPVLEREINYLNSLNPSCIAICNNTLHEGLDQIKDKLNLAVPLVHMVDETVIYLNQQGYKKILLTGTKYTMEGSYFRSKLEASGLTVVIPDLEHRSLIQNIQNELATGKPATSTQLEQTKGMLLKYTQCDSVLTGCTELPFIINAETSQIDVVDPSLILCNKLINYCEPA